LANVSPMEALRVLLKGSFGSPKAFAGTLKETTPLLIAGLAVFFALKAGLFNIGVEGQFLMGALGATVVGLHVGGVPGIVLGMAAGVLCGLLWALPAALIKAYKNGHEVITTIMLNNVAAALTLALVKGPLRDPGQEGSSTATLDASLWLPSLDFGTPTGRFSVAILAGLALVVAAAIWLKKTVGGYELRATGANPVAAAFAGVKTKSVVVKAMCVSGALGGMAGALHVFASEHRFYDGFSSGYGFDALGVALLAGSSPYGLLPAAIGFGALAQGSTGIQILGVPKGLTYVVLGLLVLTFAVVRYRRPETHE
jgi:ABC-type uncharacterized transport system permease subunit